MSPFSARSASLIFDLFSDEFDVYMDAVNRRIAMKMMVSATKCSFVGLSPVLLRLD
jgi:hypothetical protein